MASGCHGLTNVVVEDMFNALLEMSGLDVSDGVICIGREPIV